MALPITTWEFRQAGSNDNGGGFKTGGSGTDYSQQDAAQLTLTDLATDVAGTNLSSATGGFTALMVDNIIYIKSGASFTPGFYQITAHIDTNNVTIDRSAGSSATAGTGSVGGARVGFLDAGHFELMSAGDKSYVKAGTYTLTENIDVLKDGTTALAIFIEGYNATRGDAPTGNDMPLIACGAFTFSFDNNWRLHNLRGTGSSAANVFRVDNASIIGNCKGENSSTGRGIYHGSSAGGHVILCEGVSTGGDAINCGTDVHAIGCYVHDSLNGIGTTVTGGANMVVNNLIDTCTTGIAMTGTQKYNTYMNNTVYNCTTGFSLSGGAYDNVIMNNIIDTCTTGMSATGAIPVDRNMIDYNNFSNNGTDVTNVVKGSNTTSDAPSFTDAPNGDFTNALDANAAPKISFPGGLTGNFLVQGAAQPAAGGGEASYGFIG